MDVYVRTLTLSIAPLKRQDACRTSPAGLYKGQRVVQFVLRLLFMSLKAKTHIKLPLAK